jgi:hypothetical protein
MSCKVVINCGHHKKRKRKKLRLVVTKIQIDQNIFEGEIMATQMTDIQQTSLTVSALDAKNNPAALDGPVVFVSSDPTILNVQPTGPNSCAVVAVGALGNAQVQFSADADLGSGVVTLSGISDFTIVSSQATQLNAAVGPVIDQ